MQTVLADRLVEFLSVEDGSISSPAVVVSLKIDKTSFKFNIFCRKKLQLLPKRRLPQKLRNLRQKLIQYAVQLEELSK